MSSTSPANAWQLLAVDLDSTLIGRDHKVNATDAQALRRAQDAGIKVAICTGRNITESAGVIAALNLEGLGVFANGGTIADMHTGRHTACTYLGEEMTARTLDFFGLLGHAVLALIDHPDTRQPHYVIIAHGPLHQATKEWLLANRMHADLSAIDPFLPRVVRLGIVVDVPEARAVEEALTRRFGPQISHYSIYSKHYDCQVIEAFPAGVSKWTGILEICREDGIDPARVVTIGDDVNDIPMLENATLSFAVANAPPAIRARAKRVTASQEQCGVARVVEGLLKGEF